MSEERQRRHVIRPDREQAGGRPSLLVAVAVIVLVVIGAFYLAQSARTAAAGRNLQNLEERRQALEQQNAQLRAEIAALQSVPRLTARAEELGFHPAAAGEIEYMPMPDVPLMPAVTPTPVPSAAPEPDADTLGDWLAGEWQRFLEQIGVLAPPEAAP